MAEGVSNWFDTPSRHTTAHHSKPHKIMRTAEIRRRLKPWMLPIAMLLGIIFHNYIGYVAFLSKYLIFIMLLITYCRVKINDFHMGGYIWWLLLAQIGGAVGAYLLINPFNHILAQGAFICFFCPTATAAPVITGLLGGSVPRVATFSLLSHVSIAFLTPVLLSWISGGEGASGQEFAFGDSIYQISVTVMPLILGPLIVALMLQRFSPRTHRAIATHQGLSFYIWAFALLLVVGNAVSFILREHASQPNGSNLDLQMLALAGISLIACVMQFYIGRKVGSRYGDTVSGSQSLGQKNTVLAIWLCLTYLNPLVTAAPAAYVAWHNTFNSWQIYRHEKKHSRHAA